MTTLPDSPTKVETAEWMQLAEELANDLEAEIRQRYAGMLPALQRRFERDMEPVNRARAMLALVSQPTPGVYGPGQGEEV